MTSLKQRIETLMRDDGKPRVDALAWLLFSLSRLYEHLMTLREMAYHRGILKTAQLPCSVISIGNITLGGTGKTPFTLYLAKLLRSMDYKVVILSRGYKGKATHHGGIVSNGAQMLMTPEMAGDEPFMMASDLKEVPVIVGQNRFQAGMLAMTQFQPDVILLDDAFQHLKLARDINIVLLDNTHPFGNGHLLPRGSLREPLSALLRADAFIMTRCDAQGKPMVTDSPLRRHREYSRIFSQKPIFCTAHLPYICKIVRKHPPESLFPENMILKDRRVLAFSGIAQNKDFYHTLDTFQCHVADVKGFPDHHAYTERDIAAILHRAAAVQADMLVTTEKDYVRMLHKLPFPLPMAVIGIRIAFKADESAFTAFIKQRLP